MPVAKRDRSGPDADEREAVDTRGLAQTGLVTNVEAPPLDANRSPASLDPDQQAVVTSDARHLLVLAGAGTGKTRALVHRVIRLLDAGVSPSEILLLTFTRKAASTMQDRLAAWTHPRTRPESRLVSPSADPLDRIAALDARGIHVGTFHTMAWRTVRAVAPALGVSRSHETSSFDHTASSPAHESDRAGSRSTPPGAFDAPALRLLDPHEAVHALAELASEAASRDDAELQRVLRGLGKGQDGLRVLSWRLLPERAWQFVSPELAASPLDTPSSTARDGPSKDRSTSSNLSLFASTSGADDPIDGARRTWTEHQRRRGVLALDDVVAWWWHALDRGLATFPTHVLVDEIQDLDPLQWAVVARLAAHAESVTLVGDLAQSIYGFRGAVPPRVDDLRVKLPGLEVLTLRHNHRSNAPLVALGNAARADDVRCIPTRSGHAPPVVLQLRDTLQQAEFVAQRCEELLHDGRAPTDVAVLARTKAELLDVAREFVSRGIPYRLREDEDLDAATSDAAFGAPAIELSTVHRAKGLEWPVVFVIGLVEGRFPLWGSDRTPAAREEESRLFHVAVTRARDELYLTHTAVDATSGLRASTPSRFLRRLERTLGEGPPLLQRWDVEEAPRE